MYQKRIGQIIRELRLSSGLSQESLAKNICSQAQISKLEVGYEIPYSNTLYEISKKLGVDMNYFFEVIETPEVELVKKVQNKIRECVRTKDYKTILQIVNKYKNNPSFQITSSRQFLLWHEAIAQYYCFPNKKDQVLTKLKKALSLTQINKDFYKEREIEILISIAVIYNECKLFDQATCTYLQALKSFEQLPQVKNMNIKIRILYDLSRNLYEKKEYDKSNKYAVQGIDLCIKQKTFYLMGELFLIAALNSRKNNEDYNFFPYLQKSIFIFELTSNIYMLSSLAEQLRSNNNLNSALERKGKVKYE